MGGGISCSSVCGDVMVATTAVHSSLQALFPCVLPPLAKPNVVGMLIVQVLRDKKKFTTAPKVFLLDGQRRTQAYNTAGSDDASIPKRLTTAKKAVKLYRSEASRLRDEEAKQNGASKDVGKVVPELGSANDTKNPQQSGHTMYIMMLNENENTMQHLSVEFEFNTLNGLQKLVVPLDDKRVIVTSQSAAAFGTDETTPGGASSFYDFTLPDATTFSGSVIRYHVLPNYRNMYDQHGLDQLLNSTRNSDFNPYPKPINHIHKVGNSLIWENWATTLATKPVRIYSDDAIAIGKDKPRYPSPRTLQDCVDIVNYARQHHLKVRVFGSNHSFAPLNTTNGVLVDNRLINTVDKEGFDPLGNGKQWPGWAMTVTPIDNELAGGQATCTFAPGISTGDLERWLERNGNYCLKTSTLEDVFTMGGILTTGCHGTGKYNPTISDWVVAMEFVDWEGKLQKITKTQCSEHYLKTYKNNNGADVKVVPEDVFKAMLVNLGSFGIIWSYTMIVYPHVDAYLTAKILPWKDLFDDTDAARENLFKIQQEHTSVEFFYFPFRFTGKLYPVYELNPYVYCQLISHKPPANLPVYTPSVQELFGADVQTHMGIFMLGKAFKSGMIHPALFSTMPYLSALTFLNVLLTKSNKNEDCAWKLPQWRAQHPFNAIGAVEGATCVDIEWLHPTNINSPDGLKTTNRGFGDLIREIHAAHTSSSDPWDPHRFPVTIAAEMRIIRGSGGLMSMVYSGEKFDFEDTTSGDAWSAPEIVSHAGNAGWNSFYEKMNTKMITNSGNRYGSTVHHHQAKEFAILPGIFTYLRKKYRSQVYKETNTFDLFCFIRDVIDPHRLFVNPYLEQYFYTDKPQYDPPKDYPYHTRGFIEDTSDKVKKLEEQDN